MIRIRRPSPGTAVAICALVVALGGAAFAAIPDSGGTIHACYQKSNGALRVVESSAACRNSEQALDWRQQSASGGSGNIVARARSTQSVTTVSTPVRFLDFQNLQGVSVPMTGASWTQGAAEVDTFFGQVTYRKPFSGHCSNAVEPETAVGVLAVVIKVDGDEVAVYSTPIVHTSDPADPPGTYTRDIIVDRSLFEPNASAPHTITVDAADNCGDGNHFVVESVAVDVVAFD